MKRHGVMKFVYGLVGLSVITMIILTVYQQRQIRKMRNVESPVISNTGPPPMGRGNTDAIRTDPSNGIQNSDAFSPSRTIVEDGNAMLHSYAVLFEKLALPSEKKDSFKTLLVDLQRRKTDLNMEMLDMSTTEEERKEARQRLETLANESDGKIYELLGMENFKTYLAYEKSLSERTLLALFFRSFPPNEEPAASREEAFIEALFEERKRVESERTDENEISSTAGIEAQISRVMETTDHTHSGYIKVAGMYLSPPQMERFKDYLNQRRDMMEMSLNAMRQVFGDNPVSNRSPEGPDGIAD